MIKRAVSALDHERNSAELPPDSTWLRYLPLLRQNHWRKMDAATQQESVRGARVLNLFARIRFQLR